MNIIKELARTIIVIMILVAGVSLVSAWTAPTKAPPAGNVSAPVNVGALSQVKTGALQVNGFRNIGNSIFDGNVGIGTAAPTQKLDVAGIIKTTGLQLTTGAAASKVLTSDASGNATWQAASGGGGAAECALITINRICNGAWCDSWPSETYDESTADKACELSGYKFARMVGWRENINNCTTCSWVLRNNTAGWLCASGSNNGYCYRYRQLECCK